MKLFYLILSILFIVLAGCSTTFKATGYPSKAAFRADINSSIKNRDFNLVKAGRTFTCFEGSQIKGDSLYAILRVEGEKISLKDIKDIQYFKKPYELPSASIMLKTGKELSAENVRTLLDSSLWFTNIINEPIPLSEVRQLSYTNHWKGILPGWGTGLFCGALIGGITTAYILDLKSGGNHPERDWNSGLVYGSFYGMIAGAIVGAIIGWTNIYLFKP
jgi:hypothetical protein